MSYREILFIYTGLSEVNTKIANGVYVLEVESKVMGGMKKVYPVVTEVDKNSKDLVLFDTCFPGQYDDLVAEFTKAGLDIKNLTKIVLTHHHIEHVGNITEIMSNVENMKSLEKLTNYDIDTVITFQCVVCGIDVNDILLEIVK